MTNQRPANMTYPEQLKKIKESMAELAAGQPKTMAGFASLHKGGASPGVLDAKTKELIALAIAVTVRCDGCIAFHTHDALKAGATPEEIMDALGVAILMGGGPSMIYSTHVVEAIKQFTDPGVRLEVTA